MWLLTWFGAPLSVKFLFGLVLIGAMVIEATHLSFCRVDKHPADMLAFRTILGIVTFTHLKISTDLVTIAKSASYALAKLLIIR